MNCHPEGRKSWRITEERLVSTDDANFSYIAELGRKGLHVLALAIPFGMWWVGMPAALYAVGTMALLGVAGDILRAHSARFNAAIQWLFGPLMRAEECPPVGTRICFNGATCVLVGAALLALLFPLRIAVPVLVMAMLADAAAALVGRRIGRHSWGSVSATVEGTAAFVATGLVVVAFFPSLPFGPAAAGVAAGAVAEALPLPINDNIWVPLVAALVVTAGEVLLSSTPLSVSVGLL